MKEFETRTTSLSVMPVGEPTFSEMTTHVEIQDEGAGEFVEVKQFGFSGKDTIRIDKEEWPAIRSAIDAMVGDCRVEEKERKELQV